jgi:hypothetical protein
MNIESLRKEVKKFKGAELIYNRRLGAYQVVCGFLSSEIEYPSRVRNGKLYLTQSQCKTLLGYAYTLSEGNK